MKNYLIAIYHPEDEGEMPSREALDQIMQNVRAVREDMKAAGAWVFSGGLDAPGTSTVLRMRDRNVLTMDGPFVESKEHIGGVTIVRTPDREAALEWARKLVRATGLPMEVRPFLEQV
jgi:hypothetical protein